MRALLKRSQFVVGMVKAARLAKADCQRLIWWLPRRARIEAYLRTHPVHKLNIGSGSNLVAGWLNADLQVHGPEQVYLDATKPIPLPACSFDYVFTEHMIEHLGYMPARAFLVECHRVLKPGGKIRIATPNLESILSLSAANAGDLQRSYTKEATDKFLPENRHYLPSFVINNFFWGFGHYFVFDPPTLKQALEEAGFVQAVQKRPGESADVNLQNLESHGNVIGEEMNRFETFVMEAVRP